MASCMVTFQEIGLDFDVFLVSMELVFFTARKRPLPLAAQTNYIKMHYRINYESDQYIVANKYSATIHLQPTTRRHIMDLQG